MVLNHLSSLLAFAYSLTIPELSSLLLVLSMCRLGLRRVICTLAKSSGFMICIFRCVLSVENSTNVLQMQ
jgi:hypothetical protein